MITYTETPKGIKVVLSGKIAGHIKKVTGGWQYFATGSKQGGEVLDSV